MAPAAYHNSVDTAERLEKAGLQHMARACSALPEASVIVILQARRLWAADHVPNVVGVAASRPAIAIMVVLGVLARQRGEATVPGCWPAAQQRCCRSSWPPGRDRPVALLIMVRPGHATYLWATHADRIRTDGHSRRLPLDTDRLAGGGDDFLGSTSATTPWAWNRYPGSSRDPLILPDHQSTTPPSLSLAAASNHDQRRFAASRGSAVAARASSGPWRREPPPGG
jgi:hypothetical protein